MKKTLILIVFITAVFFYSGAFAQSAKIIDLGGQVSVKESASGQWGKAKANMLLNSDAEVQTGKDAYCTLVFDEEQRNIVTIKQDSHIKIESIKPGSIFLPEGRVFSLIKNLSKSEKFQVRTPTAIAGARGTGWVTGFNGSDTSAGCFDDVIFVQGLDAQGNTTEERDLSSGSGMDIGPGGRLGQTHGLEERDFTEWNDFSGYTGDITGQGGRGTTGGGEGTVSGGLSSEDLRQEQREDTREDSGESRRQEKDSGSSGNDAGQITSVD